MAQTFLLVVVPFIFLIISGIIFISRYKKCPPDKILVIHGKVEEEYEGVKILAGGATFVFPIIQNYDYLDLARYQYKIDNNFDAKGYSTIQIKASIDFAISNIPEIARNAANCLLGKKRDEIYDIGKEIIHGQITAQIIQRDLAELAVKKKELEAATMEKSNVQLNRIGLHIVGYRLDNIVDTENIMANLLQKHNNNPNKNTLSDTEVKSESNLRAINIKLENIQSEREHLLTKKMALLMKLEHLSNTRDK